MSSSSDEEADGYGGIIRLNRSSPTHSRKPVPPPRSRVNPGQATYANIPGTPQLGKRRLPLETKARGGSLDRKLADMKKLNFAEIREKRKQALAAAADELQAELKGNAAKAEAEPEAKPPTPPLHRCPSFESRIYQVASSSIKSSTTTPTHSMRAVKRSVPRNVSQSSSSDTHSLDALQSPNIPVYASVQGRVVQIRTVPFSGESSDSSDNETDGRVTTTTTASSTTSGDGSSANIYATPFRRVKRVVSIESGLSDDYDVPPDAVPTSTSKDLLLARDEPKTPRRYSSLRRDASQLKPEALEKAGYLSKLGGKLKTWNKRWFVLKNGTLSYYRNQSDSLRSKPRAQIKLDENCRINANDGSATFQLSVINKKKEKIYYLCADSNETQAAWGKIIQEALRRQTYGFMTCLNSRQKPAVEGWVTKVKHGHAKKVWCVLAGKTFLYFKSPSETSPLGCVNMRQTKVEEVQNQSDSDNEDEECQAEEAPQAEKYTIAIIPKYDSNPTYLLLTSKQDFDAWLYHLVVVSSGDITGTLFEHAISKLMQSDSPLRETANIDSSPVWSEPILVHSKESITQPLTTLPNDELRNEAVQLFKSLQLFMSVPLDSAGIDYHVALVQNSLDLCLARPELQNEIYSQLIKQTSRAGNPKLCAAGASNFFSCATQSLFACDTAIDKTSPTNNAYLPNLAAIGASAKQALERSKKPPEYVFIQGFQLLSLVIPLFLPTGRILWLLKQHLRRCADPKTDVGQYASYCVRAHERAVQNGPRLYRPSRMEVLGILLRNPFQHSLPHSIPVCVPTMRCTC